MTFPSLDVKFNFAKHVGKMVGAIASYKKATYYVNNIEITFTVPFKTSIKVMSLLKGDVVSFDSGVKFFWV